MKENYTPNRVVHKAHNRTLRVLTLNFLVCLFGLSALPVDAKHSQQKAISIHVQDVTIQQAFSEIEKSSDYVFLVADNASSELNRRISLKRSKENIHQVLDALFHGTDLEYHVVERQVSIYRKEKQAAAMKQQTPKGITIKGRVTDKQNEPLPGVSILIKGSTQGVATDMDGHFTLSDLAPNAVLEVSYVGMKQQSIPVKGRTELAIVMEDDEAMLGEIVVTGYQTLSKERATGSFTQVKQDKLDLLQLGATSVKQGLTGAIPGVFVGKSTINIRGVSSIYANKTPLFVVDGVPVNDIETINPKDIETITVLKDASAASIWGIRASNGVIVITTKLGKLNDGKTYFDISSNIIIDEKPDFGYLQRPTTAEYIDFETETIARGKGWFNPATAERNGYSRVEVLYYKKHKGQIDDAQLNEGLERLRQNNYLSEQDMFFRNSIQKQVNLSIAGGTSKYKYYTSVGYTGSQGMARGNSRDAVIINMKSRLTLLKGLELEMGVNTAFRKNTNNGVDLYAFHSKPYELNVDENGSYLSRYTNVAEHLKQGYYDKGFLDWTYNLKQEIDNNDITSNNASVRLNTGLEYTLFKGLKISTKFLYEAGTDRARNYRNLHNYYLKNLINSWTVYDATKKEYKHKFPKGPLLDLSKNWSSSWTQRNLLTFDSVIDEQHSINAIAGTEVREDFTLQNKERYYNYNDRALSVNNFDAYSLSQYTANYRGDYDSYRWDPEFSESKNRFFSVFLNGSYSYQGKYTVSGSVRIDQSDLFGTDPKYRYDPTWSSGLSWRLSEEAYMKNISWLNHLLVRLTYGINGNISKSSPYSLARYGKNSSTQEDMLTISTPENQQLRKEKTAVTNFGVDFALLNNRLSGSIDLYHKYSSDLLGNYKLDPTTGFNSARINTAEVSNRGLDMRINGMILHGTFGWDMTFNLGYNVNRVEKVQNPQEVAEYYISGGSPIEGKPLSYLYSYKWAGLSEKGEPQIYDASGEVVGWKKKMSDIQALKYVGTLTPPVYGGIISTFTYRNFALTPVFSYQLGHVMRLPRPEMVSYGLNTDIAKRWKNPGDEKTTNIPRIYSSSSIDPKWRNYYLYNDAWDEDASFVKLNTLTLSYDFAGLIGRKLFSRAQLVIQASNLWMWTANNKDIDPEYYDLAEGRFPYLPPVRSYTIGVNLNF